MQRTNLTLARVITQENMLSYNDIIKNAGTTTAASSAYENAMQMAKMASPKTKRKWLKTRNSVIKHILRHETEKRSAPRPAPEAIA